MTVADILGCRDPSNPEREPNDFFATPIECTEALLAAELPYLSPPSAHIIWEPACGDGAISKVLHDWNYQVISTDLVDRGYGQSRIDFLMEYKPMANVIITNPPFKLAHQFAMHAHGLGIEYMAMLVKADFFCSQRTGFLFEKWKPARKYDLTWRPDFKGGGAPPMTCSWIVWNGKPKETSYHILNKPEK